VANSCFTLRSPMPASAEELYAWHARPLAFQRLQPPWQLIDIVNSTGTFGTDGYRIEFRTNLLGPFKGTWLANTFDFQPGRQFQDEQIKGPFAFWNHIHRMIPGGPHTSFLEDSVEYRLPFGRLSQFVAGRTIEKKLAAVFAYRHALTHSDILRHHLYRHRPRLTIAVTGSHGLVGSELVPFLTSGGHQVLRLVTGKREPRYHDGTKWVHWVPRERLEPAVLDGIDAIIHLAGDNVASGRWTTAKKRKILESRTIPTRRIAESLAAMPSHRRPKVMVSASAIGQYGDRGDEPLDEDSLRGSGFFPDVCQAWEEASAPAAQAGIRTVHARIGVVISPKGAALGKQLPAFKLGAGAVLGSGRQWVSWITIGDLVGALHHSLMNEMLSGPVNCVAPNPIRNREFTKSLAKVLRRPAFLWLPGRLLRLMFGELADEGLLASLKVLPKKLLDSGFAFDNTGIEPALRFLLGRQGPSPTSLFQG
jgi:uncharacterized protein (TIGR01777 family)